MIQFFQAPSQQIYAVQSANALMATDIQKLQWLFGNARLIDSQELKGDFVGFSREMITPWGSTATEIAHNIGVSGIKRIELFTPLSLSQSLINEEGYDPLLERVHKGLNQDVFEFDKQPDPIIYIDDIAAYNEQEGLALSEDEVEYLNEVSKVVGRKLTDSEVFGFSQVNSEHCRHKIFNGQFVIDGEEKEVSLFKLIRQTSEENPNQIVSAYKDNVAFISGPSIEQFAPKTGDKPDVYATKEIKSVLSLKAETHNFPTTVEPFNGGATGSGGEIRDRMGGGKSSLPLAGISVYMTSYTRNSLIADPYFKTNIKKPWEAAIKPRKWTYQTPEQILIKASNGASDYGNKHGQPLICGSLVTFEHKENNKQYGFDKVIMMAGGIGFTNSRDAMKGKPEAGDQIVVLGGDNYRIGMGGGAGSSVDTGHFDNEVELNAIQRSNPELQKRVANVIRALAEAERNPVISIHDHGAGGHLNCLSELVETTGGKIDMSKLPIGDPTLSAKEIIANESQERMGLLVKPEDLDMLQKIADREQAPMYVVGETTGDMHFSFEQADGQKPIDLQLEYMFGKSPKTVMTDQTIEESFAPVAWSDDQLQTYIENVLQLESVACKDWLTNKVDRSVTGKVARQQCLGEIQLPLSDLGVVALDYRGKAGVATAIGHAPIAAIIDAEAGSVLAVAEALTNIVWVPLKYGIKSVSLSANWMWPCKNPGEDARLYQAVESCSRFARALEINIPTGKDSLSMTQKYGEDKVFSPGTVIITAMAEVSDVQKTVSPVLVNDPDTSIYYIDFSFDTQKLGGSALAQTMNKIGHEVPTVKDPEYFKSAFEAVQELVSKELVLAGHDISEGGMFTALLEMCFANAQGGLSVHLDDLKEKSLAVNLFAENPGVLIQVKDGQEIEKILNTHGVGYAKLAKPMAERRIDINKKKQAYSFSIDALRDFWYRSSYLLDKKQSGEKHAWLRYQNYKNQPLSFNFKNDFRGTLSQFGLSFKPQPTGVKAAVIREKGSSGERELAYALYLAGFEVKDVHMTDLVSGRETLKDVQMIVFSGGSSNADVFGSGKGWAGRFLYNEKAKKALDAFYKRTDTLSFGVGDGCSLMLRLGLIAPGNDAVPEILPNDSAKFESAFVGVTIPENQSIMLGGLSNSQLGAWISHDQGKFKFPKTDHAWQVVAKYAYEAYPANPNGSEDAVAGICSADGRHLAVMIHIERGLFPWQWAHYPTDRRKNDQITPWVETFVNARKWIEKH
jgi:phosphoribosylformylglycinamidine synthase